MATQRLVVAGAGASGTLIANILGAKLRDRVCSGGVQVTLIGDGFRHYFQPANLDVAFKGSPADSHSRDESGPPQKGLNFTLRSGMK